MADLGVKHLALIAAIAEQGQLSLAAEAVGVTQPAASRCLAEAEARVGVPLFERHPRGMVPTAVGETLARRARNVLDELRETAREVEHLRRGRGGVVRIGAVTGAAVGYVVPVVRQLKAVAPEVEVHVEVAASEPLLAGLMARRYDLVLARVPQGMAQEALTLRRARGERVSVVARADHPAAGRRVGLTALAGGLWVMQGPGAPIRRAVEEAFLAAGGELPANVVNTSSLLMVLALMREPGTLTAVSAEVAEVLTFARGDLVVLDVAEAIGVAPYALITLRERRLSPAAAQAVELLTGLLDRE